jgi:hypothetical protein
MNTKQDALDAIDRLFGDKSVPISVTKESLEEVRDEIRSRIECLEADLRRDTD